MKNMLQRIIAGLDTITADRAIEPDEEILAEEVEVGELDKNLRRQFALTQMYGAKANAALERMQKAKYANNQPAYDHARREYEEYYGLYRVSITAFWQVLRSRFDLHDKDGISVKKGWKVVWYEGAYAPYRIGVSVDATGKYAVARDENVDHPTGGSKMAN